MEQCFCDKPLSWQNECTYVDTCRAHDMEKKQRIILYFKDIKLIIKKLQKEIKLFGT